MNAAALRMYQALPPGLRSIAASLYGARTNRQRYGADTDALVEQAAAREHWSAVEWKSWQENRLACVLDRARTSVTAYRHVWETRERSAADARSLHAWPVLSKQALRDNPRAFLADGLDPRRMWHEQTSGTTGTSLDLWWSWQTVREWYALYEGRIRRWHGVTRFDRWAMFGGRLVVAPSRPRPPYWTWNAPMRQLYCSAYHLSAHSVGAYLDALRRYRVRYAVGYSSALYAIALLAEEAGLTAPRLAVVITNAEPLFQHQREVIGRVFQCPVRETYGMSEIVACATECERGGLHLWPDAGIVEVLADDGTPVAEGETGRLICTGLINADMPLIRYDVGDRGALERAGEPCACGRTLPLVSRIDGRDDDMIVTPDGRFVGRLDPVFKSDLRIREAQIVQESRDGIRVLLVPGEGYGAANGDELRRRLTERLGPMRVELELVDRIPRTSTGKFRAVVSHVRHATAAARRG